MFDFPSNPTQGQVFTANGVAYAWNGYAWAGGGATIPPPSAVGIPSGGAKDQVLTKLSASDYSAGWANIPAVPPPLPMGGTKDQVLTKLSSTSQDAGWVTPAAGGGPAYVHPTGDGNLHVPATGTTNKNRRLTAGSTAGNLAWTRPGAYQGNWDAAANSPALVSGTGTPDDFYTVSVAGSTSVDGVAVWAVGDQVRFNGSIWQKVPAPAGTGGGAPPYVHPTGDGNLHVPATGTANNGKVLTAGASAGALSWQTPAAGGGSGSTLLPDILSLGGVGDGSTSSNAAFTAAEATPSSRIWLQHGTYVSSGQVLNKRYTGVGKLRYGGALFDDTVFINSRPTFNWASPSQYYDGDTRKMNGFNVQIGSASAVNLCDGWNVSNPWEGMHPDGGLAMSYFNPAFYPYFTSVTSFCGHSGVSARLNTIANNGALTIQVQSPGTQVVAGARIRLWNGNTGLHSDHTVVGAPVLVSGSNYNINLNRAVVNGPHPAYSSWLTTSSRSMQTAHETVFEHQGGGDAYCHIARMAVYCTHNRNTGQTHFFDTATGGLYGGDLYGASDGVYLTAMEMQYVQDETKNIAVIHEPIDFGRMKDNGAYGCTWVGDLFKGAGLYPGDAGWVALGNWKNGLDTVSAVNRPNGVESPNGFTALNMSTGQKIRLNSRISEDAWGKAWYGNVLGDCYLTHNPVNNAFEIWNGVGTDVKPIALFGGGSIFFERPVICQKDVIHRGRSYFENDVSVYRTATPDLGFIFLNQSETRLVGYDGSYYKMPGADLLVNGVIATSDERLKENVRDMTGGLVVVDGLHPVVFDWIGEGKKNDLGLIAQEVQAIAPEIVAETGGENNYLAVDYGKGVVMHLVLAVQQLSDKVAALEAALAAKG